MNPAYLLGWVWALATTAEAAERFDSIYISEVLVQSRSGNSPKDGKSQSWIELHNGGFSPVNLAEWFLSDTSTNLTRWRFPQVVMLADSYLLLSASGTNHTNDLSDLHTNFRLEQKGGELLLTRRGTNIMSRFVYPRSAPDVSFGSVRGEPALRGPFKQPTPGKANQSKGGGFAPAVLFSLPSSSMSAPATLTLSCGASASSDLVIRYTVDGSLPSSTSPVYGEALQITNTLTVRARAFQNGVLPGPPRSEVYLWMTPEVLKFKSKLPVLVMSTAGIDRQTGARSSYLSVHEPVEGSTTLKGRPTLVSRGRFHMRGSSTSGMPQPSLALELRDEFNQDEHHPLLGLPSDSDWVLYAPNVYDPVLIHNPFIHQLSRDLGRYSSRTKFLEVFIVSHPGAVTPQDYAGLYVLEEKIKIGKNRVAIDKLGANDLKPPEVTGGYLLKFDRTGPGEQGFWAGGADMVYVDPKEPVIGLPQRAAQRRYLASFFSDLERVLDGPDWKDPIKGYPAYIDVESWIDFHVLETLSGNVDVFHFSTFFYKPRGGKLTFGPHWDFDRALGSIDHRDANPRRWNTGRFFEGVWWRQLFTDPDFWQRWVDRWQELRQTTFSEKHLFEVIDRLADEVREAQPREAARWDLEPRGASYQSEIDWMKRWLTERMAFIDRQLVQPPAFSQPGGRVTSGGRLTLSGPEGATIYYTLNGSDPRLTQGGISSNAVVYSGPITVDRDVRVISRARNPEMRQMGGPPISSPWSRRVSADLTTIPR